jgi:EAL domain-containing protein (putative c-di-GMP-specific phosphodiesterase class I)/CheY-like chemotaxis protein
VGEAPLKPRPYVAFVLDDEVRVGAFVCKMLTMTGVEARQFVEPLKLLSAIAQTEPDLLVLDLALGQSDAVDVIRRLKILKFKGSVLLISGRDELILVEINRIGHLNGLHMLQPLLKPFRITDLRARIDALTEPKSPDIVRDAVPMMIANTVAPRIDLEAAMQKRWLEVWYQPKIDLKSLHVCGAEALLRVRHPECGVIAPADFLPPSGDPLWKPLSVFVLCRAVADWGLADKISPLKLAVNVPASTLNAPGFVDIVRETIRSGPRTSGLLFEITEDEIIRDPEWIREVVVQLQLYNVSFSIDDFGTAYSSLSRLKDLPFRELKLDRSFVSGCAHDPVKHRLCQTVVDLAHSFKASACAEGIETGDELRCLRELGFDTAQGYFFAKPMPLTDLMEFLVARKDNSNWDIQSTAIEEARRRANA